MYTNLTVFVTVFFTDAKLADMFWLCSRLFTRCGYKLEQSSIVIFTSNEEPHHPGSFEYNRCFIRAKDLQQLGINVVLVPMIVGFDGSKFYKVLSFDVVLINIFYVILFIGISLHYFRGGS